MKHMPLKFLLLAALMSLAAQPSSSRQQPAQPSSTAATTEKWERYTYAGEEFSVEMPEMPFVFETSRSVGPRESEAVRTFGLYSDGVVYFVTSFDNPREGETLDYFAAYESSNPNFRAARDIKLGGFEGREYESTGGIRLRERVFRAKRHAYRVRAMSYGVEDPRITRFLDSFALGGKPAGVRIYEPPPPLAYGLPVKQPPATPPGPGRVGGNTGQAQAPGVGEGQKPAHVAGEPYKQGEVERKAIIVFKPEPSFTEEARRNNVTGVVRLRVVFTDDGKVKGISVIKVLPDGLTEKAINAARHILFFPAQFDARNVSQYATLEYNFNIY
jgi:TonB family protein